MDDKTKEDLKYILILMLQIMSRDSTGPRMDREIEDLMHRVEML